MTTLICILSPVFDCRDRSEIVFVALSEIIKVGAEYSSSEDHRCPVHSAHMDRRLGRPVHPEKREERISHGSSIYWYAISSK